MTTWDEVQVGDWVRGKDGALWAVTARESLPLASAKFTMSRKGKADFSASVPLANSAPEIVRTAQGMQDEAIAVVADVLGGQVLHSERDGIYACPPDYSEPGALMAHLHILHDARFGDDGEVTLSALEMLHKAKHAAGGHTPHHHTPDYLRLNREQ